MIRPAQALDDFLAGIELRALRHAEFATRSRDDALELVQDAMLAFVRRYAGKPAPDWPPLFWRVLQNRIVDWQRRARVRGRWVRQDDADGVDQGSIARAPDPNVRDPLAALADDQAMAALQCALEALPLRQRQVFLLRCWEGLDVADTARSLGLSQGSVKTHLFRAMGSLRGLLEEHR